MFIACDLVAQAEHDPDALCVLITTSRALAKAVQTRSAAAHAGKSDCRANRFPGAGPFFWSLLSPRRSRSRTASRPSISRCRRRWRRQFSNAGSIFLDEFTPQSAGDYVSGPNHVLPTGAMARLRGGLSVLDFVTHHCRARKFPAKAFAESRQPAIALAEAEGLRAHAESLRVRCSNA